MFPFLLKGVKKCLLEILRNSHTGENNTVTHFFISIGERCYLIMHVRFFLTLETLLKSYHQKK